MSLQRCPPPLEVHLVKDKSQIDKVIACKQEYNKSMTDFEGLSEPEGTSNDYSNGLEFAPVNSEFDDCVRYLPETGQFELSRATQILFDQSSNIVNQETAFEMLQQAVARLEELDKERQLLEAFASKIGNSIEAGTVFDHMAATGQISDDSVERLAESTIDQVQDFLQHPDQA